MKVKITKAPKDMPFGFYGIGSVGAVGFTPFMVLCRVGWFEVMLYQLPEFRRRVKDD